MREIKFRGKRIDNGEWAYFDRYGAYVDKDGNEISPKRFIRDCGYKVHPETVGQYTGLKDKNGKEVFEGDILPCADKVTGKVFYEEGLCAFAVEFPNYKQLLMDYKSENHEGFEVIGSVYENPELLEGEK